MIDAMRFCFWYHVSHYHVVMMNKEFAEQAKYVNDQESLEKFRKHGKRVLYHVAKFDRIQKKLDVIKERICEKHPEMREEA